GRPCMRDLAADAAALRALHRPGQPLVLANVWDAATASVVAKAGAKAIATSSIAVAMSHGLPDQDVMPPDVAFVAVAAVAAAVDLPVTADIEAGYRLLAPELIQRLLGAGAVGCNIEDTDHHRNRGLVPIDEQARRLASIRAAATAAGVPIVLNARIDLFHDRNVDAATRVAEAIERGRAYLAAGADCVYPIFLADPALVKQFVDGVGGPVNVNVGRGGATVPDLAALGVSRISAGGGIFFTTLNAVKEAATALFGDGAE
ncbi:MAG: isocitrate lyase/PEP mutase family protein, partial [Tepidiformaceae bacterium]